MTFSHSAKSCWLVCRFLLAAVLCLSIFGARDSHAQSLNAGSPNDWRVSAPQALQRAIGEGVNRVPENQRITLSATVSQVNGFPLPDGQGPNAVLRRILVPGPGSGAGQLTPGHSGGPLPNPSGSGNWTQSVPTLGEGNNATIRFTVGPLTPGVYVYKVCLTGLKDARGYPAELCGPGKSVTAGVPAAATWKVGRVTINGRALALTPFSPSATITNRSNVINPVGGRYIILWVRKIGAPANLLYAKKRQLRQELLGNFAANSSKNHGFVYPSLNKGQYEFRACLSDVPDASQVDSVCGPLSLIDVGTVASPPPPQPVAPVATACTGGRSKNAQGRCVCPTGSRWNQRFKRCTAALLACTGGKVRNAQGACACPTGLIEVRGNCARLQGVVPQQITIPGLGQQPVIRCSGGTLSNGQCLCPRGWSRRTIKKDVYVCKAPSNQTVPSASQTRPNSSTSATTLQSQQNRPAAAKFKCIGGQVRGNLCWCGIGRFPKTIGKNVYRCQ